MATKKSEEKSNEVEDDPRGQVSAVEERRRRKEEATTVDGSESPSVNPPGDPAEGAKKRGRDRVREDLMVHPLYNYGLPVLNSGQPAGGTPAVTTGEVEQGSLGSPHTPPANSGSSWGSSGAPSEELVAMYTPVLTSINPTTAVVGGADLTLTATGTGFRPGTGPGPTSIYFNNSQEPTTYVSATSVTTGVKPSTASGAATVPVHVANAGVKSAPQDFTFTAAE